MINREIEIAKRLAYVISKYCDDNRVLESLSKLLNYEVQQLRIDANH